MLSQAVLKGAIGGRAENQYLLGQKYYYGKGTDKNLTLVFGRAFPENQLFFFHLL